LIRIQDPIDNIVYTEPPKLIRVDPDIVYDEVVNNYGLEKIYVK